MRSIAFAPLLVLLFGCGDGTILQPGEAGAADLVPAMAASVHGPVVAWATGSGHDFEGPDNELRTFSFGAVKHADGHVSGEFQMNNRARDVRVHGTVTCLEVDGNLAWVGVVVDWVTAAGGTSIEPGQARGWLAVDNGEGAMAVPDEISGLRQFDDCLDRPPMPTSPIVSGNIQVR